MHFSRKGVITLTVLVASSAFAAAPASATVDLTGQAVHADYIFATAGHVYENDGTQTVTAGGVTFAQLRALHTTVTPTQVIIHFDFTNTFTAAAFNGIKLSEVGPTPITFTNVIVDPASTYTSLTPGRLTFDAHSLSINFQSLPLNTAQTLILDINPVPEASQFASLGVGMLGLAVLMLRTRKRKASV